MKIFLLRHTSLNIEPDIFYGQSDIDVSKNFKNEVSLIKKKMNELEIDDSKLLVFSSPLRRCVKLSEQLFNKFKTDERLKELNFGDWENKKISQITQEEIEKWKKDIMNFQIPNGETNRMFFERLKSFCDEIFRSDNDFFIVAHAGSINCIISYLANIAFDKLVLENWKKIGYGSISLLIKNNNQYDIELFGK